jgi:undecaprenyl-diphosphatase
MLSHIHALILGIVEGFTEFLPISSTAHMVLVSDLLKISQSNFTKTFEIAIQSGAILAVLALYWKKFLDMDILKKVVAAFIPTAILGLAFYKFVKNYLLGNTAVILWALALGGVLIIIFEYVFKKRREAGRSMIEMNAMTYKQSILVGLFQSIAMIPGVSRSAATIIGGELLGISRSAIVEFSFLLAVPTMLAATGLDLLKNLHAFSSAEFGTLAVGFAASFITGLIGIRFLLRYIKRNDFTYFGVYRILLVLAFILFIF